MGSEKGRAEEEERQRGRASPLLDKKTLDLEKHTHAHTHTHKTSSFETSAVPIKIIVTVPAGELKGVSISPTGGALVVEGPVEPQTGVFNISSV